jgi:2-oxoglutarate ferredoxin oxidoreductase subunit beta
MDKTKDILKEAVAYKGYALVDIFQPCITFNRLNTYDWFKENTYYLGEDYDPADRVGAFRHAVKDDKFALGVIYKGSKRKTFEEGSGVYGDAVRPLYQRDVNMKRLRALLHKKRGEAKKTSNR